MFVSVGTMRRNQVVVLTLITYPEWAMFPLNREFDNLWCLSGRQPLHEFHLPCCQETGHWQVVYSGSVGDFPIYGAWPEDSTVCPFCSTFFCVTCWDPIHCPGWWTKQKIRFGNVVFLVIMLVDVALISNSSSQLYVIRLKISWGNSEKYI
jgi:hypothetical protein